MTRKRKKGRFIVTFCLLVLVAATVWQWDNIEAVMLYSKYSKKEIDEKLSAEIKVSETLINKLPGSINDLTDDEKKRLINGGMTQEEAVKIIIERSESSEKSQPSGETDKKSAAVKPSISSNASSGSETTNSTTPKAEPAPSTPDKAVPVVSADEKRVKELVAQLYVLRAVYTDSLDKLIQQAKSEYQALPASEKNSTGKKKILLKYLGQATAMENSCDASVNALLSELTAIIKRTGGDLSLVEEIQKTYKQEKSLKKANYISQFSKM